MTADVQLSSRRSGRAALAVVGAGVALVVGGGVVQALQPPAVPSDAGSFPSVAARPAASPSSTSRPAAPVVPPAVVSLPGVAARVVPARVVDGALDLPENVDRVGWWTGGAGLTATTGSIVLAGHVDSARQGLGAFSGLRDLPIGARVSLTGSSGSSRTFVVSGRRSYAKAGLPASVFDQRVPLRLVLITCTGHFDLVRRSYDDNLVVYAVPA